MLEIENVWYGQIHTATALLRSVGLHPWYLKGVDLQQAGEWLMQQLQLRETVAVGEAGLDKITETPWALQMAAFEGCIAAAQQSGKPLLIHCVRAYAEVLACLNQAQKAKLPALSAIFHGFDKHPNTAKTIWQAGHYLSFGSALFKHNSHAAECLRQIPEDRFFLETDVDEVAIEAVYERAAAIRAVSVGDLSAALRRNFEAVFDR